MQRFTFKDQRVVLVRDPVGEVQPHSFGCRDPDFDDQCVVVACWGFVAEMCFNHWEDIPRILQLKECRSRGAK